MTVEIPVERTLEHHIREVLAGNRRFENVFESITRMVFGGGIEKKIVNGQTVYDFQIFRRGRKPLVGMYNEITSFVNFVKTAAEGVSSKEMAFVLIGEPGNGKTYFVQYVCDCYRKFLMQPGNRKFTFRLKNLDMIGDFGDIKYIESQTFEDPMIIAMNMFASREQNKEFIAGFGFTDKQLEKIFKKYRSLGACSEYNFQKFRELCGEDPEEMMRHIEIVPVPITETLGTVTGKYSAKDKITSKTSDLLGEESIQRMIRLEDINDPLVYNLRKGALARVGGGGIHFSDEIFKNKTDLVLVYIGLIQDRTINLEGFTWHLDTLIIATSNNDEFNKFRSDPSQAPIVDRFRLCFMAHNTDYKLQNRLTRYAIGDEEKTTFTGESLHEDPNLAYVADVAMVLTRLPHSDKLSPIEMLNLASGETAGEKSVNALREIILAQAKTPDVIMRFGQKGLGHRALGKALQVLMEIPETHEGKCMYANDLFTALKSIVYDYVVSENERTKYLKDFKTARELYKQRIKTEIYNAFRDDPKAVEHDVMVYVNMVLGVHAGKVESGKEWTYKDSTGKLVGLKIDERYINAVEERLGLKTEEQKKSFRDTIIKAYGREMSSDPSYNFMDNNPLVAAVTEVRLDSDVLGAGSLVGALANRTRKENQQLYDRMMNTMIKQLGYCDTCAVKTLEDYITPTDES